MIMEEPTAAEESDDQSSVKSDDQLSMKSDDSSGSNRVKFLYSYGGRILPRPGDGKLRYVSGETRVMAVSRNITFADLMAKITEALGSIVVLKCQLPTEDLDALVSIKSDEDLENVLEEYDRLRAKQGSGSGSSKVRAFLFPVPLKPLPASGHMDRETRSGPPEAFRVPQISQAPPEACFPPNPLYSSPPLQSPRGQHRNVSETLSKAGRPPRSPAAHPDAQSVSTVRYAPQIHGMAMRPRQQNFAARAVRSACVDERQFVRVGSSSCAHLVYVNKNYQYITPPTQVPFSGKATRIPHHRKTENILHNNPYPAGVFHVHH